MCIMNKRDGYHSDRSEGQQVVVPVAVAPAVPAGVLALLQDVHLSAEVHLLPTHPTKKERNTEKTEEALKGTTGESLIYLYHGNTHGPHSTRRERTLSMPISHTFMHSLEISIMRP